MILVALIFGVLGLLTGPILVIFGLGDGHGTTVVPGVGITAWSFLVLVLTFLWEEVRLLRKRLAERGD